MAHALPIGLEKMIIDKALKVNKNFILIAEEFENRNSAHAAKSKYQILIGNFWAVEPRWQRGGFKKIFERDLPQLKIPLLATSETHDTPRTITRYGKDLFYYFSAVFNYFIPNTITFINTGFELKEIQPMNKGLDSAYSNIYSLPKKDLNYGKMALFDFTSLHWNTRNKKMILLMEYCSKLMNSYPEIKIFNKFKLIKTNNPYVISYFIPLRLKKQKLLFIINTDMMNNYKIKI